MLRHIVESNRPDAERNRFRELAESEFGKVCGGLDGGASEPGGGITCKPGEALTCTFSPSVPGNDVPSCD